MNDTALLKYVLDLQNRCHDAVGFLTKQALREYEERGQIIPATEAGDLCGFATYYDGRNGNPPRKEPTTMRVYQVCVQDDSRRIQHGTGLVSRILYQAQAGGFQRLGLWCATDLDAAKFWRALGFTQDKTRIGGESDGRLHDHWFLNVPRPAIHPATLTPPTNRDGFQ